MNRRKWKLQVAAKAVLVTLAILHQAAKLASVVIDIVKALR